MITGVAQFLVSVFYATMNHVNTPQVQGSDGMPQEHDLFYLCLDEMEEEFRMEDLNRNGREAGAGAYI
jgi:hypothetical protein